MQGRDSGAQRGQTSLGGPSPGAAVIRPHHAAGDEGATALVSPGLAKVQKSGALKHTLLVATTATIRRVGFHPTMIPAFAKVVG